MIYLEMVTALVLLQYLVFGALAGRARTKYQVPAPAVTGHEVFERYYRVQMNTLEIMVVLLPALWLATRYWSPLLAAAAGAIYLLGRVVYLRAYVRDPATRGLGFMLSFSPAVVLVLAALAGSLLAAFK